MLEYEYSNFYLEILEYCNKESLINKEQYYIDIFMPEYNICKKAGSMLGFKHSSKTLLKFKNRNSVTAYITIVIDDKNNERKYDSLRAAVKGIGISNTILIRYIKKNKQIKDINYIRIIKPLV